MAWLLQPFHWALPGCPSPRPVGRPRCNVDRSTDDMLGSAGRIAYHSIHPSSEPTRLAIRTIFFCLGIVMVWKFMSRRTGHPVPAKDVSAYIRDHITGHDHDGGDLCLYGRREGLDEVRLSWVILVLVPGMLGLGESPEVVSAKYDRRKFTIVYRGPVSVQFTVVKDPKDTGLGAAKAKILSVHDATPSL